MASAATLAAPSARDCDQAMIASTLLPAVDANLIESHVIALSQQWLRWPGVTAGHQFFLYHSARAALQVTIGEPVRGGDGVLPLHVADTVPGEISSPFPHVGAGVNLWIPDTAVADLGSVLRQQLIVVQQDAQGRVLHATGVQLAGALDDRYRSAGDVTDLGASSTRQLTQFKLWAPTAQAVHLCLFHDGDSRSDALLSMQRDDSTGIWQHRQTGDQSGRYYSYLVDVVVPGLGVVRNRVTDPYSLSLTSDSRRSYIADLNSPVLKPAGWDTSTRPSKPLMATDLAIYELHVRDFSWNDSSVSTSNRGKYLAFTELKSNGMQHLRALADAGITDIHLLPVFDIATIPETRCLNPLITGGPASSSQQASVTALQARDCYNWGYDPFHYTAPEGSYASDAKNGAVRIREFRQMVQALHRLGLRVGMDVVYNHTSASGQAATSVLDRIVPGYYQRLNERGQVETSTCCANTATEHRMMAKLMIESAVVWARDYQIDSFRFDLMGHQPRAAMEQLQTAVNAATGRHIHLIGEGWNFGEIASSRRFVQASQLSLNGSGIGTFSDRARDAVRGGGAADSGLDQLVRQGFVNGLHYAPNAPSVGKHSKTELLQAADMVRVGLAGSLRQYRMRTHSNQHINLSQLDYAGQPAGYVSEPGEVVNYVEKHDNATLFDLNVFKLPLETSAEDRARVQILASAVVAFSQGTAYFHAGQDLLRSKSMDRNSFDSGDWFNRIDWRYQDNYFGSGLPPERDNGSSWSLMTPLLSNENIKPEPAQIAWTRDAFRDLLRIRASSSLFRLPSAKEINQRLHFYNTGSDQNPVVIVGRLTGKLANGALWPDARFSAVLYALNVDTRAHTLSLPEEIGQPWQLHPVHSADTAADQRPREQSRFDRQRGELLVPARTALVYVLP